MFMMLWKLCVVTFCLCLLSELESSKEVDKQSGQNFPDPNLYWILVDMFLHLFGIPNIGVSSA